MKGLIPLLAILVTALGTGCQLLPENPGENLPVVYVREPVYLRNFDPYYQRSKAYWQPETGYFAPDETTGFRTTKVKVRYGDAVYLRSRAANEKLGLVVINRTGRSLDALYVSAVSDRDWGGNLLPNGGVFPDGGSLHVRFPNSIHEKIWDLIVVDDDGAVVRFEGVRLAGYGTMTLVEQAGRMTARVE